MKLRCKDQTMEDCVEDPKFETNYRIELDAAIAINSDGEDCGVIGEYDLDQAYVINDLARLVRNDLVTCQHCQGPAEEVTE